MFLFLLFSLLLLCSFLRLKELFSSEKWFNYVVTFFFLLMPKIWVGQTTLKGEKKEDGLSCLNEIIMTVAHGVVSSFGMQARPTVYLVKKLPQRC